MKRLPVPGVRDLVGPHGRVQVEVLDGRGRTRKRVAVENAIMDWLANHVPVNGGRGPAYRPLSSWPLATAFDPLFPIGDDVVTDYASFWRNGWFHVLSPAATVPWVWATGSSAAVDTTKTHIPGVDPNGEVVAGFRLTGAWANDGVTTKRASQSVAEVGDGLVRVGGEFPAGIGTGVWRSIGLGSLLPQVMAPGGLRASPQSTLLGNSVGDTEHLPYHSGGIGAGDALHGCVDPNGDELVIWACDPTFALYCYSYNPSQVAVRFSVHASNVVGSSGFFAVAVIPGPNTDLWIAKGTSLYRCVKPTGNESMTATNTYDLSGSMGSSARAMCTDGTNLFILTDTHIVEVDPATGAVVGSPVAHGVALPGSYGSLEWDPNEQGFWIGSVGSTGPDEGWGPDWLGQYSHTHADELVLRCIDKTGADTGKRMMGLQRSRATDEQTFSSLMFGMSPNGLSFLQSRNADNIEYMFPMCGATMGSHALLPADIDKTAADALRVTYEFNWA